MYAARGLLAGGRDAAAAAAGQAATAEDSTRADLLLIAMRAALLKYADVRMARGDGFAELPGRAKPHDLLPVARQIAANHGRAVSDCLPEWQAKALTH